MADPTELTKKISKSLKIIEKIMTPFDNKILVGLSGGKDSLVIYDLCMRVFGQGAVVPFHLTFIPGLRIIEEMLKFPIERFGIKKIYDFPDYTFFGYYKEGMYSWETDQRLSLPDMTRAKIYPYIANNENK